MTPSTGSLLAIMAFATAMLVSVPELPADPLPVSTAWIPTVSPPYSHGSFRHKRSRIVANLGEHHHSAADVITTPNRPAALDGKFAYGGISKDLEDEDISLWLRSSKGWRKLATRRTNDDGRVRFNIPGELLTKTGAHKFSLMVNGDGTAAHGSIWVQQPKTKVVVFDIDGTLTTGDSELVEFIATGNTVQMRRDADSLVKHWLRRGIQPIYLTGRPYLYNRATKVWLQQRGFPLGPLATTKFVGQGMPSSGSVGAFKQRWLTRVINTASLDVVAAYGNASTDICAFARAGILPQATYIIGDNGGSSCKPFAKTRGLRDFSSHLRLLKKGPSTPPLGDSR